MSYLKKLVALSFLFLIHCPNGSAKDVVYKAAGKDFEGYFLSHGKNAPLVIILHDWDGLTGYEKKRSQMLHKLGYSVFAADLFGKGIRPTEVKDKRQHTGELMKDRKKLQELVHGAYLEAVRLGANGTNMVVMGYCFGGAATLEYARSGANAKAFVTFHGGLSIPEGQDYSKTKGMVIIHHGTADNNITMEHFATLANELEKFKIPHEMITYGGAPHAFTVFDNQKSYHENADKKSWKHLTAYLEELNQK